MGLQLIRNAGVSYMLQADETVCLFDVGYGDHTPAFSNNIKALAQAKKLPAKPVQIIFNSHFHLDHNGGNKGLNRLTLPTSPFLSLADSVRVMLPRTSI